MEIYVVCGGRAPARIRDAIVKFNSEQDPNRRGRKHAAAAAAVGSVVALRRRSSNRDSRSVKYRGRDGNGNKIMLPISILSTIVPRRLVQTTDQYICTFKRKSYFPRKNLLRSAERVINNFCPKFICCVTRYYRN